MSQTLKYQDILSANIAAISSVMAPIRASIGPKGLDVMLVDEFGSFTCTNDGVEILSNIKLEHPAAKLAVEAAKAQELQIGDGTSTVAILCDSMLNSALGKIDSGASPNRVAQGIELATQEVIKALKRNSHKINGSDDTAIKAITKISARGIEDITGLIVAAAKKSNRLSDSIVASTRQESQIIDGLFIKKKSHFETKAQFKNPDLILIQGPMEPEPMSSEAVNTDEGVRKYDNNIQSLMEGAKKIVKAGVKAVICSSSVFPTLEEYLAKEGVFVLSHVKESNIKSLIELSGARLNTRSKILNSDIDSIKELAGALESIKESKELGGFIFQGSKSQQVSILISAETETRLEERQRIAIDAARALEVALQSGYVLGEGKAELNIISELENFKKQYQDQELVFGIEVVIEALSASFDQIVTNAGFNPNEAKAKLKTNSDGIDLDSGSTIDLLEAGIIDALELKISAFKIASEIASQILRINMIAQAK